MVVQTRPDQLHLGFDVNPDGTPGTDPRIMDPADLTTHGVIVGMTGSGKTGLGIVLIEELLASGRPVLALDPKGDLGNLLLNFPNMTAADVQPWLDPAQARSAGTATEDLAAQTAAVWEKGLAESGVDSAKRSLVAAVPKTLFTPGSTSGVPLSLLGSLTPPPLSWDEHAEALRDEIEGLVSGLLSLAGLDVDPVSSREHILLATLVERAWRAGETSDLAALLGGVQRPPFRKLGVLDLDAFFPAAERDKLVLRLNGLLASPSFQPWLEGPALDINAILGAGEPRVAVISLAHLSEAERVGVVTMVLSKVVTWMRGQSGTGDLRGAVYMDEVFGFAPPTAEPPSKKPLMTLMKTARAYGVGIVLSTQNPVDLDYKIMSNAGTWMVGRLQTERDKSRLLDGIAGLRAGIDTSALGDTIAGLAKRQFLLHSVHTDKPQVFATRWAMSYMAGPLTLPQIRALTAGDPLRSAGAARGGAVVAAGGTAATGAVDATGGAAASQDPGSAASAGSRQSPAGAHVDAHATPVMPKVADAVVVRFADPAAPWIAEVGGDPRGALLEPAILARVHLRFDDATSGVEHDEVYEVVFLPLPESFDPSAGVAADYDARDLVDQAPPGALFALPDAPIHTKGYFQTAERAVAQHLARSQTVQVLRCRPLRAYGRVGETPDEFTARLERLAEDSADAESAKERATLERRAVTLRTAAAEARLRLEEAEAGLGAQRREELVAGSGRVLGALFGGRLTTKAIMNRAVRAASGTARERSQTQRAEARVETLGEKVDRTETLVLDFEREILDRLAAIESKWDEAARDVDQVSVGLKRSDVVVEQIVLCWVPTSR